MSWMIYSQHFAMKDHECKKMFLNIFNFTNLVKSTMKFEQNIYNKHISKCEVLLNLLLLLGLVTEVICNFL